MFEPWHIFKELRILIKYLTIDIHVTQKVTVLQWSFIYTCRVYQVFPCGSTTLSVKFRRRREIKKRLQLLKAKNWISSLKYATATSVSFKFSIHIVLSDATRRPFTVILLHWQEIFTTLLYREVQEVSVQFELNPDSRHRLKSQTHNLQIRTLTKGTVRNAAI